jgi:DNA-cytosine methyltransferase
VTLTVGSTFTGIGGADLGFEWAGFRVAWQCEFDPWKQSVLRAHWPDVPLYDDITTLHDPPTVDVMLGGFPCQDLSVAGKRKGFDGERSVLAFEFLRVAESIAPRWIVLENVPGLLSSNRGRDFARLVDEMVGCGYGVGWRILDARYFGVPQRRRRIFLVARRADAELDTRAAGRLALRALLESGSGDPTPSWPPRQDTPADAGVCAPASRLYNATAAFGNWVEGDAAGTLSQRDYKSPNHLISFYPTGGSQ